jgi:hypothetical protein
MIEYAIVGLIGRTPDERISKVAFETTLTVIDLRYKIPMGQKERYRGYAVQIRQWLDWFDIQLSGTRVDLGMPYPKGRHGDVLQIKVSLPPIHAVHV